MNGIKFPGVVTAMAAALIASPATAFADCGDPDQPPCTGPVPTVDQVVAIKGFVVIGQTIERKCVDFGVAFSVNLIRLGCVEDLRARRHRLSVVFLRIFPNIVNDTFLQK